MTKEFECNRCGKIVSAEQYEQSRYCPKCGTYLLRRPQPNHWLFQFNPGVYRWFDRINETSEPEQWLVSQNSKLIHKGDFVAIWSSGQKAGIYALAQIIAQPTKKTLNPIQEKYFFKKEHINKFNDKRSTFVTYLQLALEKPVTLDECNHDPILADLQVFLNPQGTNFYLRGEQWDRITELLTEKMKF